MEEQEYQKNPRKKNHKVKLVINLPKDWVEHLIYLEKTTSKKKDDYIKEALSRHLEQIHELQLGLEAKREQEYERIRVKSAK